MAYVAFYSLCRCGVTTYSEKVVPEMFLMPGAEYSTAARKTRSVLVQPGNLPEVYVLSYGLPNRVGAVVLVQQCTEITNLHHSQDWCQIVVYTRPDTPVHQR